MITYHNGNILDSGADYICHQVNCQGKMNSGVAKAIRTRWPIVYDAYLSKKDSNETLSYMLGKIQFVPADDKTVVVNIFGQDGYGYDGKRYTSYDAFWNALHMLKIHLDNTGNDPRIAFPAYIGCVRGGANWNIIQAMIEEVLGHDYNVEFWRLDNG